LDILLNRDVQEMIYKKSMFWNSIRSFLLSKNFTEVQTPALEHTTGGADAKPFVTHHNYLDIDVYLRISMGELWQKRLLVGGLERAEIGSGIEPQPLVRTEPDDERVRAVRLARAVDGIKCDADLGLDHFYNPAVEAAQSTEGALAADELQSRAWGSRDGLR